jgi:hypothetical protein
VEFTTVITPTGDVRLADPRLWFGATTQEWPHQQLAISDLTAILPEVPVLLSARFRDSALRSRIDVLRSIGSPFAVEPNAEASEKDAAPSWLRTERPWLMPPVPNPNDYVKWMASSIRHQDSLAPALLITPSPTLIPTNGAKPIEELADAAEQAAVQVKSRVPCLLGISGSREWLRTEGALQSLGNVVVHTKLPGVYVRISHREQVVRDRLYLAGLRNLVTGLAEAGLLVFLPNSGRLGWLALGWGTWAISAGITLSSWSEREPTPMNQPRQPSQWYYEHQLGIDVRWRHHQQLVRLRDYEWCECEHCEQLQRGYDPDVARRHSLEQLANDVKNLAASNGVAGRTRRLRQRLGAMKTFGSLVTRRLGAGWEGYELDYVDRWLEVI